MKKFIDITRTLGLEEITYPGDPRFEAIPQNSLERSDLYNTTYLKFNNHTGTHIDAPRHFFADGKSLDEFPVERFFIETVVIEIFDETAISEKEISTYNLPKGSAVLFKTKNQQLPRNEFDPNYIYLSVDAAQKLVENEIALVGIDYLSVDSYNDTTFDVHKMLLQSDILILEDINLKSVPPGIYQLVCLPLKIFNSDAAPCRAVLIK